MSQEKLEGAGPFYFEGNEIGILFIHGGGGGTCADLRYIAQDLHKKKNYTLYLPLLPGFGTSPEDLRNTEIQEWKEAIKDELEKLREKCPKTFIGGHSMGGMLTLIFASQEKVDGIFTIASPIGIKSFAAKLAPFFNLFIKYYPTEWEKFKEETDGKWIGYKKIPLNIVLKLRRLLKEMKENLSQVECPALLMQGSQDSVIKPESMNYIYEKISSQFKTKRWLDQNDHALLDSPDHDLIVAHIIEFIENVSNRSS